MIYICNKCGGKVEVADNVIMAIETKGLLPSFAHDQCPPPGDTYVLNCNIIRKAKDEGEQDSVVAAVEGIKVVVADDQDVKQALTDTMTGAWGELMGRMIMRDHSQYRLDEAKARAASQDQEGNGK